MRQFLKHHVSKDVKANLLRLERWIKLLSRPKVLSDLTDFNSKKKELRDNRFSTNLKDIFPITGEDTKYTSFDRHYTYHTSWAARVVKEIASRAASGNKNVVDTNNTNSANSGTTENIRTNFTHIDISSSLYFSGIVSAFIPVDFYDYRPADLQLSGLTTKHGDLTKLPFEDKTVHSLSCMHTIEHVGLGRYGDPIDPKGDIKAIKELMRVVAPKGNLILVVPVGRQRIEFNAHRIYNPQYIQELVCEGKGLSGATEPNKKVDDEIAGKFELKEYAYIPETDAEGGIMRDADLDQGSKDRYACGCFWFVRKA